MGLGRRRGVAPSKVRPAPPAAPAFASRHPPPTIHQHPFPSGTREALDPMRCFSIQPRHRPGRNAAGTTELRWVVATCACMKRRDSASAARLRSAVMQPLVSSTYLVTDPDARHHAITLVLVDIDVLPAHPRLARQLGARRLAARVLHDHGRFPSRISVPSNGTLYRLRGERPNGAEPARFPPAPLVFVIHPADWIRRGRARASRRAPAAPAAM